MHKKRGTNTSASTPQLLTVADELCDAAMGTHGLFCYCRLLAVSKAVTCCGGIERAPSSFRSTHQISMTVCSKLRIYLPRLSLPWKQSHISETNTDLGQRILEVSTLCHTKTKVWEYVLFGVVICYKQNQ